jgi:hypothetical protein
MERIKARDAKILELEKETALLRDEKTMIELEVRVSQSSTPLQVT